MPDLNLILHLPLDEIEDRKLPDISKNGLDGTMVGTLHTVYDTKLGAVTEFLDSCVRLPVLDIDFAKGFSASVWVKCTVEQGNWARIFDFGNGQGAGENFFVTFINGKLGVLYHRSGKEIFHCYYNFSGLSDHNWYHVTIAIKDGEHTLYINGSKVMPEEGLYGTKLWTGVVNKTFTQNYLGYSNYAHDPFFRGQMSHLRLFASALTEDSIREIMEEDTTKNTSTVGPSVFAFDLYTIKDDNYVPVLFIESIGKEDALELQVKNDSGNGIMFREIKVPDINNYHFQLRFRRNVLSTFTVDHLRSLKTSGSWNIAYGFDDTEKVDYISFASPKIFELAKSGIVTPHLDNISAAAMGGARNTRVEVRYSNIYYSGDTTEKKLYGTAMRHMEVLSHQGLKNLPLYIGIEGSNTLLNDKTTANKLTLAITNPNAKSIALMSASVDSARPSKFVFGFHDDDMSIGKPVFSAIGSGLQGTTMQGENVWTFTFNGTQQGLEKGSPFRIEISNWISGHPSGTGNIYVEYQNIPGYWDGVCIVPVQFGEITERHGTIGIGMLPDAATADKFLVKGQSTFLNENGTALNVKGTSRLDGDTEISRSLSVKGNAETKELTVHGKTNIEGELTVHGGIKDQYGLLLPPGTIVAYAGSAPPPGWLLCNGDPIVQYPSLMNLKLPGNRLPDLRSRFILGAGQGDSLSNRNLTEKGGGETHTLTINEMPIHRHYSFGERVGWWEYGTHDIKGGTGSKGGEDWDNPMLGTTDEGGGKPHDNMPPFYVLNYIIKY